MAVFSFRSGVHGTTMLLPGDLMEANFVFADLVEEFERALLEGLTPR